MLKNILKKYDISEDAIKDISQDIQDNFINKNYVDAKEHKKALKDLEDKISNYEKDNADILKAQEKYNAWEVEYNQYKESVKTQEKQRIVNEQLKDKLLLEGANQKILHLLIKDLDCDKLELTDENKIKDLDKHIKGLKENYSDFFNTKTTSSPRPSNPPINPTDNNLYSKEQIKQMTTKEINANWDIVSKSLERINN